MNNSDLFGNFETNKNGKKSIKSIDEKIKKAKKIKTIVIAIGGSSPVALVLLIILMAVIAVLLPIFVVTTMVGGSTIYGDSKNDLPDDLTINGVDQWSDEEKKIFDDLTNEKQYYDNGFSVYNAGGILKNEDDELDISTPISTIHYQGTVNLTAFDDDYFDSVFNEDNSVNDYNDEKNVKNRHTRDFYKKAGEKLGNTFMIYPGMRMLLGNLVSNKVTFYVVEYDGHNAAEILSDWNLLGKIPSSNSSEAEGGAKYYYSPEKAIKNISRALSYGENNCSKDSWLAENICYDTELLYDEIFGGTLDNYTEDGIVKYLVEEYEAAIPTSFSDSDYGTEFIAVRVEKQLDYKLYEKYLKEIYIPYVYINCDTCGYRNDSQELKDGQAQKIFDEIMQLTNSFKKYNEEDYIDGAGGTSGIGGTGSIKGVTYECGTNYVSVSTDYCSTPGCRAHNANDISIAGSLTSPNIYPIMEGEVVVVNNSCHNICPSSEANRYIAGASLSSLSSACSCGGGFGNYVRIKSTYNGKTIYATYAHLSSVNVSVGETVTYNTILGVMGTTGVSTGRHLHLELSYNSDYSNKFPATVLFTTDTVKGTTCSRNISSEEQV